MDDLKKDFFAGFDWKSFEQFFGGKFPLSQTELNRDTSWVDRVVKDVMAKALPQPLEMNLLGKQLRTEVFETHNNIIVKVYIPDKEQARSIRPFLSMNKLKLEGLENGKSQSVKLTSPIIPKSCKAVYKDGVLQLHVKKLKRNGPMHEVYVQFHE